MKMNNFTSLKNEMMNVNGELSTLISRAMTIPGMSGHTLGDWEKTRGDLKRHLSEDIIRIAVVGSIKSGKSTFVNAMLKGDYLKRGAGVVTSFVTKVRHGEKLKAKLMFKSFDEINAEIIPALVLIPSFEGAGTQSGFDIRQEEARTGLQQALDSLSSEQLVTNDLRNINGVLLSCFLAGYDRMKPVLSQEPKTLQYGSGNFPEHRKYVSDEALAVYLKDIELEVNSDSLESSFEIADCQGIDSPNPLHLAMIQDYLISTNLIIYVVSSRTGIRRSDIRFLSMLKKMGILENVLFVVNCDFSDHDTLENMQSVIEKIQKDISLMKPIHEMYSFSALFDLFSNQKASLTEKDRKRLAQWENETDFVAVSERGTSRFKNDLRRILKKKHIPILFKNNLERHSVLACGVSDWVGINKDLISADKTRVNEIEKWIKRRQEQISQIKSVINSTLTGAVPKLKREINNDINRFFDIQSGGALEAIIEFIRGYRISYNDYEGYINASSFSNTMYLIYQEFKQSLDHSVAGEFNPEIVRFIKEEEKKILFHFRSLSEPFETVVKNALIESGERLRDIGINSAQPEDELKGVMPLDMNTELTFPPFVASMRFSVQIKTEAVMRFGFYSGIRILENLLKRHAATQKKNKIKALKGAVKVMKNKTEKSFLSHIRNYRGNIKYQYLYRLIEETSNSFYEGLIEGFSIKTSGLSEMVKGVKDKQFDKEQSYKILMEMEDSLKDINERINKLRRDIDSIS